MLNLHTSNFLEELAARLAEVIRIPLRSPFNPEIMVVQSQGMARWLKLQLAERHGICSNCQFPFPRAVSYTIFQAAIPDLPAQPAYDVDVLVWQVMKQLPQLANSPGFEAVRHYLADASDTRKRFQLSQQIANVLDQYLVFRPDQILAWEKGKDEGWQAQLWKTVSEPFRAEHPAALQFKAMTALRNLSVPLPKLPERLTIFGISALPPYYLSILAALAERIPVHLFLLEPCQEFWGYIRSESEQERALKRAGRPMSDAEELHLEAGNRLLASMGKLGRDFLLLVEEAGDWQESDESLFREPGQATLLARLQSDILNLRETDPRKSSLPTLAAADDSIQVHSCHSPLRELEVLYDHLLAWFEKDPELAPRDILVMIPEIEEYAPLVQGIFGSPEEDRLRIPFSVADRAARAQSHLIETFLAILDLAESRFGAGSVLALLEAAPLRKKFDLAEADLEVVRHWIEEVRIRWGRDEAQRVELGLPGWDENTWHHGLQRLLLGYALAGKGEELFQGILPYDDIEGQTAIVLGDFLEFTSRLFRTAQSLSRRRSLDQWVQTFQTILEEFFESDDDAQADELRELRECFDQLRQQGEQAGFDEEIDLGTVREPLIRALSEDRFGMGYLTGGVTFCALKPMRSIPAKIICLLGMNSHSFPRTAPQLSFNLMTEAPRLGDRSSRDDDRYLFLETLISARQRLYLSYVGQSIRDNSMAPPSVVVSELMDHIDQTFLLPGEASVAAQLTFKHRLQAFSPAYFSEGRLFSYSRENLQASQAARPAPGPSTPFLVKPLSQPEPEWRRLSLMALTDFFRSPARFLARKRLRIHLLPGSGSLEEREAFTVEALDRYQLEVKLLDLKIAGQDLAAARELIRRAGRLPAGRAGEASYAQICRNVHSFQSRLQPHLPDRFDAPISVELALDGFTISGHFNRLTPSGLLSYRPAKLKGPDLVRAGLEHLVWCAAHPDEPRNHSVLVGTDSVRRIRPITDARAILGDLLSLYWKGLSQPLKFFPKTSLAFAEADFKARTGTSGRAKKTPLEAAQSSWDSDDFRGPGESEDPYVALFFRESAPLDKEFEDLARTVYGPLLEHSEDSKE